MSARDRPASCWSTGTRLTNLSHQTAPLVTTRQKLARQLTANHKTWSHRVQQAKYNTEELFKLYYADDLRFDSFQKQIVTGTRISAQRMPLVPQKNLMAPSVSTFDSKHCVTREQLSTSNLTSEQQSTDQVLPTAQPTDEPVVTSRTVTRQPHPSITIPTATSFPDSASAVLEHHELCDPVLVKSVTFADEDVQTLRESPSTSRARPSSSKSNKSSSTVPTVTLVDEPMSRITSSQPHHQPTFLPGPLLPARQRSASKSSSSRPRPKSNTTSSSQQSIRRARPPSTRSIASIESDAPETPILIGTRRVVSIPSRCSRYVLVTFPESSLRYNAPTYVERLLLPERFPTLFQNILHNRDAQLTGVAHRRKMN